MTGEQLLTAIGLLDDELIEQALPAHAVPRVRPWRKWGSWCACLALVLALGYGVFQLGFGSSKHATGAGSAPSAGLPSTSSGPSNDMAGNPSLSVPSGSGESWESDSAAEGAQKQSLILWEGQVYRLTDQTLTKLPQDSRLLGTLSVEASQEYADCPLWQTPDGAYYIQQSEDSYLLAELTRP